MKASPLLRGIILLSIISLYAPIQNMQTRALAECNPPKGSACECLTWQRDTYWTETTMGVTIQSLSGNIVAATGSVDVESSALAVGEGYVEQLCGFEDSCDTFIPLFDADQDAADLFERSLSVIASTEANDTCGLSGAGTTPYAGANAGFALVNAQAESQSNNELVESCGECTCGILSRHAAALADSHAISIVHNVYGPGSRPRTSTRVDITRALSLFERIDCTTASNTTQFSSQHLEFSSSVVFYEANIQWNISGGGSQTVTTQGLIGQIFDGTTVQHVCLGSISEYEPECPSSGDFTIEHESPEFDVDSVDMSVEVLSFHAYDGDLNSDGMLCADDRAILLSLISQSAAIGSPLYDPRADFDLDGDIDNDDLTGFDGIFLKLSDCNTNGNPDACDIAQSISDDVNEDDIPDECQLGACCRADGSCEMVFSLDCVGACEVFWGETSECNAYSCNPTAQGACCKRFNQGCVVMSACECSLINGHFINYPTCDVDCPLTSIGGGGGPGGGG